MQDIRKQFSLDWLVGDEKDSTQGESRGGSTSGSSSRVQTSVDEAVIFYSQPIIGHLNEAPEREMRLHDLAREVSNSISQYSFEQFFDVIKRLADLGIIRIMDEDPTGNYLIKLIKML